jgi:hypothetical protein
MPKNVDISNERFGKLIAIRKTNERYHNNAVWECRCDCGNFKNVSISHLKTKHTTTCGRCSNRWKFYENFCECEVIGSNGSITCFIIDLDDYEKISKYKWYIENHGYVRGHVDGKKVSLHRFIMNVEDEKEIDHINHNPLDNRKSQLRVCSAKQNMMNKVLYSNNKSGTKGVHYYRWSNSWLVTITYNGEKIHLGYYKTKDEAIRARKEAEQKYFGEYAYKEAE